MLEMLRLNGTIRDGLNTYFIIRCTLGFDDQEQNVTVYILNVKQKHCVEPFITSLYSFFEVVDVLEVGPSGRK
jgi:hypothetical protein